MKYKGKAALEALCCVAITWALAITLISAAGINEALFSIVIKCIVVTLIWLFALRYPISIPLSLLTLFSTYLAIFRWAPKVYSVILDKFYLFYKEVSLLIVGGFKLQGFTGEVYSWLVIGLVCTLVLFVLRQITFPWGFILWAIMGVAFFSAYWYNYVDIAYPAMLVFLMSWFLWFSYLRMKAKLSAWSRYATRYPDTLVARWLRNAVYVMIFTLMIVLVVPKGFAPIHLSALQTTVLKIFPRLTRLRPVDTKGESSGGIFSIRITGFQNDSELGGPVHLSERRLLTINSSYLDEFDYLKGVVKDSYEDNRWIREYSDIAPIAITGDKVVAAIKYRFLKTQTLFAPYGLQVVPQLPEQEVLYNLGGEYLTNLALDQGDTYNLVAVDDAPATGTVDMEQYLGLPTSLSQRVKVLARQITATYNDDYDKMKALEHYLRSNFRYSLSPPVTPRRRDFVDYFLFDVQRGYCTYFASALAVMGRTINIPTRYVEGFILDDRDRRGEALITANQAHAWVEAYIPDTGWTIFEPTPAYSVTETWQRSYEVPETQDDTYLDPANMARGDSRVDSQLGEGLDRPDLEPGRDSSTDQQGAPYGRYVLWLIVVGIVAVTLVRVKRVKGYFAAFSEKNEAQQCIEYYALILHLLSHIGYGKQPAETPTQYSNRVISYIFDKEIDFRELTKTFNHVYYGQNEASVKDVEKFAGLFNRLENRLKVKQGRFKFYYFKYLKGYNCLNIWDN